jgi:hypothetical protein
MGSKHRQAQDGRKASFERNLEDRLALLRSRGIESREADKDALVKKLRADIKAVNNRLRGIDANEKKTAELARMKAEKAAAPLKEPEAVKEVKEVKEEKKVKKAAAAGKEKKKKAE